MVDHRRTASQRAYQLPGWFFVLTAVVSLLAFVAVGWVFLVGRLDLTPGAPQATAAPSVSADEPRPGASGAQPTSTGSPRNGAADAVRTSIDVVVLNASETTGLAASVADAAEEAGWTVAEIGDWIYPAVVNAVYYPEGHEREAGLLAEDLDIDSVRPVRSGMSADGLTVLLVYSP
jgi:hypothetical protein